MTKIKVNNKVSPGFYWVDQYQDCDFAPGRLSRKNWMDTFEDVYMVTIKNKSIIELYDFKEDTCMIYVPHAHLSTHIAGINEYINMGGIRFIPFIHYDKIWRNING